MADLLELVDTSFVGYSAHLLQTFQWHYTRLREKSCMSLAN